jgi:hypothetical protein
MINRTLQRLGLIVVRAGVDAELARVEALRAVMRKRCGGQDGAKSEQGTAADHEGGTIRRAIAFGNQFNALKLTPERAELGPRRAR